MVAQHESVGISVPSSRGDEQVDDLALILPQERSLIVARVEHLRQTAREILAVAEAARALVRGLNGTTATI